MRPWTGKAEKKYDKDGPKVFGLFFGERKGLIYMLSNLIVSFEAVVPMFLIILLGVIIRKAGIIDRKEAKKFNKVVFTCCFGPLMFHNLYGRDAGEAFNPKLVAFTLITFFSLYFLTVLVVLKIEKSPKSRGAMIQAIYRSNFVIMGLPVVQNVFGKGDLAVTAMMIAIVVPVYNVLAVITLEVFRGGKPDLGETFKNLLKNPIILGAIAGLLTIIFRIKVPAFVLSPVEMLSDAATPLSLLLLGTSFSFESVSKEKRNLIVCLIGRLIVFPAVGLIGGMMMGFRGVILMTLVAMFASPSAITSFTMAQQMDSDHELAGNCVIFSSICSCFTMFLWIFVLKSLGMF